MLALHDGHWTITFTSSLPFMMDIGQLRSHHRAHLTNQHISHELPMQLSIRQESDLHPTLHFHCIPSYLDHMPL